MFAMPVLLVIVATYVVEHGNLVANSSGQCMVVREPHC